MNAEQAKQLEENPIWEAFKQGKQIQRNIAVKKGTNHWRDISSLGAHFAENPSHYQVKPEVPCYRQEGWRERDFGERSKSGDVWLTLDEEYGVAYLGGYITGVYGTRYFTQEPKPESLELQRDEIKALKDRILALEAENNFITDKFGNRSIELYAALQETEDLKKRVEIALHCPYEND